MHALFKWRWQEERAGRQLWLGKTELSLSAFLSFGSRFAPSVARHPVSFSSLLVVPNCIMPSNKAIVVGSFHTHLQVLELDLASRSLRLSTLSDPAFDNYTWLVKSTRHDGLIYAARAPADESEGELSVIRVIREDEGDAGSSASTYRLEILQTVPSGGVDPCHAGISEDGKLIALTNVSKQRITMGRSSVHGNSC